MGSVPLAYYKWRLKYGGLDASDINRHKELEHENSRLRRTYADLSRENTALKDVLTTKLYGPPSGGGRDPYRALYPCRGFSPYIFPASSMISQLTMCKASKLLPS